MANKKTEDKQGMVFVGCTLISTGVGMAIGVITENWLFVGVGSVIGVGIGFVAMSLAGKK